MVSTVTLDDVVSDSLITQNVGARGGFGTSFYDANIVAAARQSGAKELWAEDLNAGQDYGGERAVNPFV